MPRASHFGIASRDTMSHTPLAPASTGAIVEQRSFAKGCTSTVEAAATEALRSSAGALGNGSAPNLRADHRRQIDTTIRQRIETRLPGRVRNLHVRILGNTVIIEGQCATYYTKQLAQHAALGVLEDEHLENAIVVSVRR